MNFSERQIEKIIKENYQVLYTAILHAVRMNKDRAEDLTQEAVVKIILALREGKYKDHDNGTISAWMIRIGINRVMDYYRKESRIPTSSIELEREDGSLFERSDLREYYYTDPELNYEERISQKEEAKQLRRIARTLKFNQREVLILRNTFKYTFMEIAERTGLGINTVLAIRLSCLASSFCEILSS